MKIKSFYFIILAFALHFHATPSPLSPPSPPSHPLTLSPYNKLWLQVDSLSNLGLPKSALEVVGKIYSLAKKEKNDPQFVKSIIYRLKLQADFQEDFHTQAILDLKKEITYAGEPVKQILQSILAEVYWKYYQNNRYRFNDRTRLLDYEEDSIQTWDLNRLSGKIIKTYMISLENSDLLKSIPIHDFDIIIEKAEGKSPGSLRPTLYDFLAWRALDYFMSNDGPTNVSADNFRIDKPLFFMQAEKFTSLQMIFPVDSTSLESFAIRIFRDLATSHLGDKDPGALIDEELKRFEFTWQKAALESKDSLYFDALEKLEETHRDSPYSTNIIYAIARFLNDQGGKFKTGVSEQHKWDLKKAVEYCEKAIDRFPESDGAINCRSLKEQIKDPFLTISLKEEVIPDQVSLASLAFKNLPIVHFRIVRADPEKDMEDRQFLGQEALMNYYLGLPVFRSWSQKLPDDGDYRQHVCEIPVLPVSEGFYIILVSSGSDFANKKDVIAFAPFFSTHISYISQRNEEGETDVYILDRESGKPMKNVSCEVFLKKYDFRTRKNISTKTGDYL